MARSMEQLEQEKQNLIDKFWDENSNAWRAATDEERKDLQRQMRELKNEIRFIKEEDTLTDPDTAKEIKEMLFPLVERRKIEYLEFVELVFGDKGNQVLFSSPDGPVTLTKDGDLFCFESVKFTEVEEEFCGCGHYPPDWYPSTKIEALETIAHMKVCSSVNKVKVQEPIARIKHSRGDWDCKGCLNTEKTVNAPEGIAQLATIKWLEWCPNFSKWAREETLEEATRIEKKAQHMERNLEGSSNDELKCYAGLLHSQIEWGERENIVDPANPGRMKCVQHVKVVRMCDTCGHRIEEEKTSEWVEDQDLLVIPAEIGE